MTHRTTQGAAVNELYEKCRKLLPAQDLLHTATAFMDQHDPIAAAVVHLLAGAVVDAPDSAGGPVDSDPPSSALRGVENGQSDDLVAALAEYDPVVS